MTADDGDIIRVQSARHAVDGERCRAEVIVAGGYENGPETGPCDRQAAWTITAHTRQLHGRRVQRRARVSFCARHVPRRHAGILGVPSALEMQADEARAEGARRREEREAAS